MSVLSDGDKRFLPLALRQNKGFHLATEWYLRGWRPLPYQWLWHQVVVPNTSFVAGIATGKTTIVAASYLIDCISIPYFRALNTSVTAKQAELAFDMVSGWMEDNPRLGHLIAGTTLRPFPIIYFVNGSEWEFRTAGVDARFIRGSEYDRINFDEAGLDLIGAIIKVLRGRLRGTRKVTNETRMGRLDVTTSPTAALWLQERFWKGWKGHPTYDPALYWSLRAATWDNTGLTPIQVEAMKAEYPPDMIDVELGGQFPDYGMSMFPAGHVAACTDQSLYDAAYIALNPEDGKKPAFGWALEEDPRHGVILYEAPFRPGRIYVMAGDPGTDNYPRRNSPCVMAADVTEKPYKIVYFWWGSGKGSYNPFLQKYRYCLDKYQPVLKGIDATGTQKGMDEVAFENVGIATDKINFTTDKNAMLNMLISDVTNHFLAWPTIKGLIHQLGIYTLENDRDGMPQDIVMTLAQISYLARFVPPDAVVNQAAVQHNFRNRKHRTNQRRRR